MVRLRKLCGLLGVILWIGTLSPEIIVKSGEGCILDENGRPLESYEAQEFMESYFFDNNNNIDNENTDKGQHKTRLQFSFKLLELFD